MRVTALERIIYASRPYQPGEEFDMEDIHGRLLAAHGKVKQLHTLSMAADTDSPPQAQPMTTENTGALVTPLRTKGRYKRRDMRSED